ncbi:MAG: DUF5666 domain-containing protein, partial [Proteobacteria bacterium]|nr:DUF5666 domain-containing protein [Pseudomonadota bacterium]
MQEAFARIGRALALDPRRADRGAAVVARMRAHTRDGGDTGRVAGTSGIARALGGADALRITDALGIADTLGIADALRITDAFGISRALGVASRGEPGPAPVVPGPVAPALTIGATVKVHFVVDANGVNVATEIETKFAHEEHGHDHDGDGVFDGGEGHAFGTIESKPTTGLIGDWAIGGITYTVVAETRILEEPSNFVVGAKVRVK